MPLFVNEYALYKRRAVNRRDLNKAEHVGLWYAMKTADLLEPILSYNLSFVGAI